MTHLETDRGLRHTQARPGTRIGDVDPGAGPAVVLEARVVRGSGGGPDKTILKTPRLLEAAGYRTVCAYLRPPGDPGFARIEAKAESYGAELLAVDDRGPLDWRVVPRLLEICRRERVAIWHGHDYKSNLLGLLLASRWPIRLVSTVHGWVHRTRRTPLYYAVDRLCLRRYERVFCVSGDLLETCRALRVPENRLQLLENGVDTDEFSRRLEPAEARRRLGLDPYRPLVGAVGRLSPEKGFDLLIRAAALLVAEGLDFNLAIVGEGDEAPALRSLVEGLGLEGRVHLLGYRPDVAELYQAMDVYALSSLREGLPNVVLEALASAVPVVATRVAGVPDLIRDEVDGLVVDPGSVAGLAESIGRLLRDRGLRGQLAEEGRRRVEARSSFMARTDRLRASYDELLGRDRVEAPESC